MRKLLGLILLFFAFAEALAQYALCLTIRDHESNISELATSNPDRIPTLLYFAFGLLLFLCFLLGAVWCFRKRSSPIKTYRE